MPADWPEGITPTYAQQYRRCGKPGCPLCAAGGRGHGPYWYAYWREAGRPRSRYLGKQPPPGLALQHTPSEEAHVPTVPPAEAAATLATPLRVRTLGGFAIWRGAEPLTVEGWERQQTGALFKWLLGAPGQRLTRDVVADHFWAEGAPERARANLRVLVHRLRRELGDAQAGYLRYDGEVLELRPGTGAGGDWLDADHFAGAATTALAGRAAGACRAALALYGGEYLPGDAYEEWALGRREELRQLRVRLLLHLAALAEADGEAEEAERCLHQVMEIDPCYEEAALALMRLQAGAGRPGQALRVYRRLTEALREELGLAPEEETQALARSLAAQLPPAPDFSMSDTVPTNLPAALSSFIGRRRELAALRALFLPAGEAGQGAEEAAPCRLLTLTGPGGVGKTRLALRLADELLDAPGAFPDGVWLAELASLAEPALVPRAVAEALGVQEEAVRPLAETLASHLKLRRLLLVLDNCEHLLAGCAALVAALLEACPGLRVLATSRVPLGVPGERPWLVPALSLPDSAAGMAARLLESEAARLFLDRARVHRPDLGVTDTTARAVARICRHLEGIPLAIELAAARVSVLGLEQIADRLGESFRLLTGGPRTAPRRQQTLRATLDWSYHLLEEAERRLLCRLSVFARGCTLEAAEMVCAGEGLVAEGVLDVLSGLVQHSLVQVDDDAGVARYRLLQTVRQYGRERLAAGGELVGLEQRHGAYYLALAEAADPVLVGPEQAAWLERLERDHDNLRAALQWAWARAGSSTPHGAIGLRLAAALWPFWEMRGHFSEGRGWLERLLAGTPRGGADNCAGDGIGDGTARAEALHGAGRLAFDQGDLRAAEALFEESVGLYRTSGERRGLAAVLHGLGNTLLEQGDHTRGAQLYDESLAIRRALGDDRGVSALLNSMGILAAEYRNDHVQAAALYRDSLAMKRAIGDTRGIEIVLNNLGTVMSYRGDYAEATRLLEECLAMCRELGDRQGTAVALANLGEAARHQGEYARAQAWLEEGLALCREIGDRGNIANALTHLGSVALGQGDRARAAVLCTTSIALFRELGYKRDLAMALYNLGRVARAQDDPVRAAALYAEGLALHRAVDHPRGCAECLEELASLVCTQAQWERAARLYGAAAVLRAAVGAPPRPADRTAYAQDRALIDAGLGAGAASAWAAGAALALDAAIAEAGGVSAIGADALAGGAGVMG